VALPNGTRLGPYEIVAPVASGGMGDVYKARDSRLDRTVAIKVLQADFSARFEREARAIAALNHAHIRQLYDVGPDFLVMEYVDGGPVQPTDDQDELLRLALQIADGLAAAHEAGIVHRDLKPGNILVTRAGDAKILDFGVALVRAPPKETHGRSAGAITEVGTILGTPGYMSPEQAPGEPADARSDGSDRARRAITATRECCACTRRDVRGDVLRVAAEVPPAAGTRQILSAAPFVASETASARAELDSGVGKYMSERCHTYGAPQRAG